VKIAIIPIYVLCVAFASLPLEHNGPSRDSHDLEIDTLYARLTVLRIDPKRGDECLAACDIILKYHFISHFGAIDGIEVRVLERTKVYGVCQEHYGACPPGIVQADSIRFDISEAFESLDTAQVSITLAGSLWDYSGDSGSRKLVSTGAFKFIDTLVVPIKVAE
jgi:hypothetical protein